MKLYPLCQVRGPLCTGFSVEAHHKRYPARCTDDYIACCHACHMQLEAEKRGDGR